MPRVAINESVVNTRSGLSFASFTTGDSSNNHFFTWGPNKVLEVNNATGGAVNVTFVPKTDGFDGFVPANKVVSVPNNAQMLIGPLPSLYAHTEDNDYVYVNVAAAVTIKVYDFAEV